MKRVVDKSKITTIDDIDYRNNIITIKRDDRYFILIATYNTDIFSAHVLNLCDGFTDGNNLLDHFTIEGWYETSDEMLLFDSFKEMGEYLDV
jgi:hypothetical protein